MVDAAAAQFSFDATQDLPVSQIGQRHSQQMPRMGRFVGQNRLGVTPIRSVVVALQHHRAMGIIATHQHQQPIYLRHENDVGHGDNAIPTPGDDLQFRRHSHLAGTFPQSSDLVSLPLLRAA